jgi:hypothetical protein
MASIISAGTTSGTALNMAGDTSGVLQLATNGSTTAVTVDASQNVGIGTTNPSYKLDLRTSALGNTSGNTALSFNNFTDTGNSDNFQIFYTRTSSASGWTNADLVIQRNVDASSGQSQIRFGGGNFTSFWTNSVERMRIDSSGNVGIGYSLPNSRLGVFNSQADGAQTVANAGLLFGQTGGWAQAGIWPLGSAGFSGSLVFGTAPSGAGSFNVTERMRIDSAGALILVGSTAQKASGTTWSNPSDQRLKDNIRDYTKGTTELMQVRVREWEYNGKGGTTEGLKGLGVVADEVMTVLPDTVETYDAKLNAEDEETTEIKKFDATEITWLLVKTVQEQQTIINDLKARITALEGAA